MKDLQGREYAKLSEIGKGTSLQTDGDFPCIRNNEVRIVYCDEVGPYIECEEGRHYLHGQLSEKDNDSLIGLYRVV